MGSDRLMVTVSPWGWRKPSTGNDEMTASNSQRSSCVSLYALGWQARAAPGWAVC